MDTASVELLHQLNDGHFVTRALHVVAELGVADQIGETPVPVKVLAERVGAKPELLARGLRAVASHGVFRLTGGLADGEVAHTPASRLLAADHPASFLPFVRNTATIRSWRLPEHMLEMVRTGVPAVGEGTMWSGLVAAPGDARIFDAAMAAKAHSQVDVILRTHDFSGYGRIVDIGGGAGHLLKAILQSYPGVTGVLFDRPDVVEASRQAETVERMEYVGGDFFAEVPGGDVVHMMDILHDWSDAECIRILKSVRRSAAPGSKLIVLETEVSNDDRPEWGKVLDIIMMTLFDGKQRSHDEYAALFQAAGFRLTEAVRQGDPTLFIGEAA